jgi:hypothetical protein
MVETVATVGAVQVVAVAVEQVLPDPFQERVVKVDQVLPLSFGSSYNDMGCY